MNAFETFLLGFAKEAVAAAPGLAPLWISAGNTKATVLLNVSDEFLQQALSQIGPQPVATTSAPVAASAMKT